MAGYRVGMILSGGLLMILFERLTWTGVFLTLAALLLASSVPILLTREPPRTPAEGASASPPGMAALSDFLRRPNAVR